ncbi:GMC oxidoreductase family protein [Pleurotus pulmonarius]
MPILSFQEFASTKFDYLVVGGGTSGLAVAARLSENPDYTVGVIEAGDYHEHEPEVTVPGMMARAIHNPKFDWIFYTVPQKHVNNRKVLQSRGKGLGGSSLLNFLASVRPVREELDAFEKLGNEGWSWDTLLHYMKKSEHLIPLPIPDEQAKQIAACPVPSLHGDKGPIAKSFPPHLAEVHLPLLASLEACGVPRRSDNSDGRNVGAVLFPTSVEPSNATRSYSATAYYAPNADRANLLVVTGVTATKVHFTKEADGLLRATGVAVASGSDTAIIDVAKEVILSAGSFQTPQLLELSGIGDKRVLGPLGIECLIDLPGVGENLQDHALTPTIVEVDKSVESLEVLRSPEGLEKHQELYKQQKGLLAGIPSSCFAFIPGRELTTEAELADWEEKANLSATPEVFEHTHPDVKRGIQKQYDIMRTWIKDPDHPMGQLLNLNGHFPVPGLEVDATKRYMTLLCAYTHPFHRGTVHITTTDPLVHPAIDEKYLSNPADLDVLVRIIQFTERVYGTKPLGDWVRSKVVPPPEALRDVEATRKYVRDTLITVHHPVGTASMLPREDGGVVNSKLTVYGTSNLRVVDCSIIPLQISANIQTLAYALAEKAADLIAESA